MAITCTSCDTFKLEPDLTHLEQVVGAVEEVSAALDDADKGDDEEGHDLHHRANLPHPGGQVDVALGQRPVEHLRHHPGLEGDHGHDEEGDGEDHVPGEGQQRAQPGRAAGPLGEEDGDDLLGAVGLAPDHHHGEQEGEVEDHHPPSAAQASVQEVHNEDPDLRIK